jgi:DNA sulfur modification protein DndD
VRIQELILHNFMPYRGEHRLDLPTTDERNVIVVFGDNMRGKTSILNALRWGLYGYAKGRHGRPIDTAHLVNSDAVADGDYAVSVRLKFEAGGRTYELRRSAELRDSVVRPRNNGDFHVEVVLRRDGSVLTGEELDHELNQLMPEQVSRFFLFDGELLQEYESLLSDSNEQGQRIKEAIEQVLGVPALLSGRKRLAVLLKQAQAVQAKENKHIAALKGFAEQQIALQERLGAAVADRASLLTSREAVETEIEGMDEMLAQTEAAERAAVDLSRIDASIAAIKKREETIKGDRFSVLRDAWRDLVQPRLRARIEQLEASSARFEGALERKGALKERIKSLRSGIASTKCDACGQIVDAARRDALGAELGKCESDLAEATTSTDAFAAVSEELSRLRKLTSTQARGRLRGLEADSNRNNVELTRFEGERDALRARISDADTAEIARLRSQRDQKLRNLGRLLQDLTRVDEEIAGFESKQNEIARIMSKSTAARSERSNREVDVYGALERVFAEGTNVLRERLRNVVAAKATESFLRLTTEKSYRGLTINENYGLSIVDRDGRVVSLRSAGAEQIVALSLIDGLNRTSRKRGPIVMDTPLGRLDPRHREAVLSEVPRMAEQVVLLVHEGEISRTGGLRPLAHRVAAAYEIVRVSSSASTIQRAERGAS